MNQNIFYRNCEELQKKIPVFMEKIQKKSEETIKLEVIRAKDGTKIMKITNLNGTFYLNSKYYPINEAREWVSSLELERNDVFIIFGFELGYRVRELLKYIKTTDKILVIEPSIEIFSQTIRVVDCTDIFRHPNFYLNIGEDSNIYEDFLWKNIEFWELQKTIVCNIPNYNKLFFQQYEEFSRKITEIFNDKSLSRNTILHFSKLWQENIIKNITHILQSDSIEIFKNLFQDVPVFIISAGPSLNKNIDLLKKIKNKGIIVCVGTSLSPLLNKDIIPDFVISIDGGETNFEHFKNIDYSNIPLIYSPKIYPAILDNHNGNKFVFYIEDGSMYEILKLLDMEGIKLGCGGSVSNCAFDFAIYLGGSPIIFVGQDLAFTNKYTHAKGTIYEKNKTEYDKKYVDAKDIYGNEILTDETLLVFLRWFEKEIENYKNKLFIDATEGGIKIRGTDAMPLSQVLDKYCKKEVNKEDILKKIVIQKHDNYDEKISKVLERITNIIIQIEKADEKIIKGLKFLNKIDNNEYRDQNELIYFKRKLNDINDSIIEYLLDMPIMHYILQQVMYDFTYMENGDIKDGNVLTVVKSKKLYLDIKQTNNDIKELLKESISRIKDMNYNIKNELIRCSDIHYMKNL